MNEWGKDTNCEPFDISISTAGCAAMRCEWKAALRRAQIRHAIGRLCPGSVLLTQLPRGGCGAQRVHPLEHFYTHRAENCTVASHQPPGPQLHCSLIPDTRMMFAFLTRNMPNSLFTTTSSAGRNKRLKP